MTESASPEDPEFIPLTRRIRRENAELEEQTLLSAAKQKPVEQTISDETKISDRSAFNDDTNLISDDTNIVSDKTTVTGRKYHPRYNSVVSNQTITPADSTLGPQITRSRANSAPAPEQKIESVAIPSERYSIRQENTPTAQAVELGEIEYSTEHNLTPTASKVPGMTTILIGITAAALIGISAIIFLLLN